MVFLIIFSYKRQSLHEIHKEVEIKSKGKNKSNLGIICKYLSRASE